MRDPKPLTEEGATDFERRLLFSARAEEPPPEMVRQLERALGIAAGAAVAAPVVALSLSGSARALASVKSGLAALPMAFKVAGLVSLALAGAVGVGVLLSHPLPVPDQRPAAPPVRVAPVAPTPPATVPAAASAAHVDVGRGARPGDGVAQAPRGSALRGEILLIDGARAALAAGAPARALRLVQRYAARFPHGALAPEAQALRIEALADSGQLARAEALARTFIAEHPRSPLSERIARLQGSKEAP
jgi:hypothetical protein